MVTNILDFPKVGRWRSRELGETIHRTKKQRKV